MRNNRKGAISLIVLLGLAITGWMGYKYMDSRPGPIDPSKTPIGVVANIENRRDTAVGAVDVKVNTEKAAQLSNAQVAVHATGEALNQAESKAATGAVPTREIATAKEINAVAQTAIDEYAGKPVDPKLMAWFIDSINKKNSDIERERAYGEQMLASKRDELIASAEREKKLIGEKETIIAEYDKKLSVAEKERDAWSLENAEKAKKLDRIYFWIYFGVGIYVLAMILPLLAKFIPVLGPVSSTLGAIAAPMIQYGKHKADTLAEDMVALHSKSKDFIESIDPAKVDAFKAQAKEWWGDDHKSAAAIEEIKAKLRI